jgi:hypothetical protein
MGIETKKYKKTKDSRNEFMRPTAGYSLLHRRRSEDILEELTSQK